MRQDGRLERAHARLRVGRAGWDYRLLLLEFVLAANVFLSCSCSCLVLARRRVDWSGEGEPCTARAREDAKAAAHVREQLPRPGGVKGEADVKHSGWEGALEFRTCGAKNPNPADARDATFCWQMGTAVSRLARCFTVYGKAF